ncbi:MAG: Uma2 family endonuclease [Lewinellaceae bacterium]|nr:Uma2 family endonuclease [Saprospiraceae bacterium]MCB9332635.1 Uma2 family endonuclease [Lewinellaceae bacterium]
MEARTAKTATPEKTTNISIRFDGWEVQDARPPMSEAEFLAFCRQNPDLRIEQDKNGNILIMPPVSFDSGNFESEMMVSLGIWNRQTETGKTFSSATLFILPNGEKRMPDAAWISLEKTTQLSAAERKSFAEIVPDFVVEIRSPSDDLQSLKTKMTDSWMANGVRLAWLLDPATKTAWIYRSNGTVEEILGFDRALSGEDVLPGFSFDLQVLKG